MSENKKTVVLLRGGIDSTICLAQAVKEFGKENVIALNMYYGKVYKKERDAVKKIAEHYGVEYMEQNISKEDKSEVPFKNGLMIATATSFALRIGAGQVEFAVHADESSGHAHPDCREGFYRAMATAVHTGTDGEVKLVLPFADMSKKQVMQLGKKLEVPFELTWSCHVDSDKACGECMGCKGRAEAFKLINEEDPIMK